MRIIRIVGTSPSVDNEAFTKSMLVSRKQIRHGPLTVIAHSPYSSNPCRGSCGVAGCAELAKYSVRVAQLVGRGPLAIKFIRELRASFVQERQEGAGAGLLDQRFEFAEGDLCSPAFI